VKVKRQKSQGKPRPGVKELLEVVGVDVRVMLIDYI
jgi:hypothetical protein